MIEIIPNWHPIFVNFTVALISVSLFFYLIGYLSKKHRIGQEWLIVGCWCLWLGTLLTIATVIVGFVAYYSVAHDAKSHEAMVLHRNWAIATFIIILAVFVWSVFSSIKKKPVSSLFILSMVIAFVLLTIAAWHGAELVFRYGVGVKPLLQSGNSDKPHHHH
ncbi:DUF2231 domain-containing protein [Coxiella burnetii]|uniref:DUF2231 domain-containing protein n=1 Tax=Coxiella burnetii (strain Dugway 5J108-111) TaxID=434922 RepID=A9KDW7_COXBN|nr:DUF2231 domain-containing protein [Coxiella burnetii]ABS76811.1 hypothetical protein CBUD_0799 [Coxiella burnetii Dugway 5J108-111]OYK80461.1 DUF2231 domain-containing protein [Coxiella burnetii]OYK82419.1 DUF2231 domain-containing protein [Coxiella burnetii]